MALTTVQNALLSAPAVYSGSLTNATNNFVVTSTTFADMPTSGGTNVLTNSVSSNMGTAAIASSSNAGIILTLPYTGYYLVSVQCNIIYGSASAALGVRLVDGSGTVIATGLAWDGITGTPSISGTLTGIYSGTAGATTFKVQGRASTSSISLSERVVTVEPCMFWSVSFIR